ncbi:MAG: glycosyltransferase [archaeon]|nr:MAG: glycosyltransferase [archaeon]
MFEFALLLLVGIFSAPVFLFTAYSLVLLVASLSYKETGGGTGASKSKRVTVLLAVYNEGAVVSGSLDAVLQLEYPPELLDVVIADDSDDSTKSIVDGYAAKLREAGIKTWVSRRPGRQGFKAGALNAAASGLGGDYTLLIDADSRVSTKALLSSLAALSDGSLSFVSYRVGHFNRDLNLVTRAFALFQDTVDSLQKMGTTRLRAPYSLQGGFALVSTAALAKAGFWREGILAEDADLSCRLFSAGFRGAYLSSSEVLSEDPSSLRVWKRQAGRVAQGWAQCLRANFLKILTSSSLGLLPKVALLLTLLSPLAALSWLVVTISSAVVLSLGLIDQSTSIFANPFFVFMVTLPVVIFYVAGVRSLRWRHRMDARNLAVLPALSYMLTSMFTISAISFLAGLAGRPGTFFRTPKGAGATGADKQRTEGTPILLAEGSLSTVAVLLSVPVFLHGGFLLGLSLLGFGLATLKSMELSRLF